MKTHHSGKVNKLEIILSSGDHWYAWYSNEPGYDCIRTLRTDTSDFGFLYQFNSSTMRIDSINANDKVEPPMWHNNQLHREMFYSLDTACKQASPITVIETKQIALDSPKKMSKVFIFLSDKKSHDLNKHDELLPFDKYNVSAKIKEATTGYEIEFKGRSLTDLKEMNLTLHFHTSEVIPYKFTSDGTEITHYTPEATLWLDVLILTAELPE